MKHFLMEDMSMDELKDLVKKMRKKPSNSWVHLLVIVVGCVAIAGIIAGVIINCTNSKCCCGHDDDCGDDCDCDCDDNDCCSADDDDFVQE